jgi:hypothetical protein
VRVCVFMCVCVYVRIYVRIVLVCVGVLRFEVMIGVLALWISGCR